jgi:hypothetical protein
MVTPTQPTNLFNRSTEYYGEIGNRWVLDEVIKNGMDRDGFRSGSESVAL